MELDEFDLKILALVQDDVRQTTDSLGAQAGLSATAVQRRLKRLRQAGVIRKEIAVLNPAALGGRVTLIVTVRLAHGRHDAVDGFKRQMQALPEVQQCYYTMGEADFVLVVTARSVEDYEEFTRRVFFDNKNIAHFTSVMSMSSVKTTLRFPI